LLLRVALFEKSLYHIEYENRKMAMNDPVAQETLTTFREEVRAFLDAALTAELRAAAAAQAGVFSEGDVARKWHHILYERGWIARPAHDLRA
jgi:hypothetical protein